MIDSGDKLKLDQTHLETVIPAPGKSLYRPFNVFASEMNGSILKNIVFWHSLLVDDTSFLFRNI